MTGFRLGLGGETGRFVMFRERETLGVKSLFLVGYYLLMVGGGA